MSTTLSTLPAARAVAPDLAPQTSSSRHRASTHARQAANQQGTGVTLRNLGKAYGQRQVLQGINLDIASGEFVAIVGRSGCGKSTLLRLLAGLDGISTGRIDLDGQALRTDHVADQGLRLMFQDARLLPWKKVGQNVALGLTGTDPRQGALDALTAVGLAERIDECPQRCRADNGSAWLWPRPWCTALVCCSMSLWAHLMPSPSSRCSS